MAQEEIIFPSNIRNIRLATGMKMTELARRAKLSLSAVSKIEKGVRRLNQKQLLNICNILGCKLSDIFIKESDTVANTWQDEIKRRLSDNEAGGLKIFGSGLRKIRQKAGKTIANAAKDAGMTLSVYHKLEVGQREVYEAEILPLAQSFKHTVESMFDEIANLYKTGDLNNQITKVKDRVKSVLIPGSPEFGIDLPGSLYGAKLYDSARKKLAPVFGTPNDKAIAFEKSDKTMIVMPTELEGRSGIYAVIPNTKRLNNTIPATAYLFADAGITPVAGDMAVCIDKNFAKMSPNDTATAQIVMVHIDDKGKLYGQTWNPAERITGKTMHKIVMIVMD
jgi:transcriptional regulator with XRE-family HTH domain